ncbi:MAG: hypothetical protein ACLFTA_03385 [Candidatus Nanohaloarchaea archaeon]
MKKLLPILLVLMLVGLAAGANLTVQVWDAEDNVQNAELNLTQRGTTVAEGTTIDTTVQDGENYNLTQQIDPLQVEIINFSIDQDLDFRPRIIDIDSQKREAFLTDLDPFYYVNQSFGFSEAWIDTGKTSQPDRIAKCLEFSGDCVDYETNSTEDYTDNSGSLDTETYTYRVEQFSGYSSGDNASLPVIENIEIFNVTEQTDKRTDGSLVDQGLNKTFEIGQKDSNFYRFEFNVSNQGSEAWELTSEDLLQHQGLNSSWNVTDIYYRLNGEKDGGDFSNGNVEWNTGNGGTLDPGESFSAEYVVNISQDSTRSFAQEFEASTTQDTRDVDYHELETLVYGNLSTSLDRPDNAVVQNNREFLMNGTVECLDGDCGSIEAEPRRNVTSGQQVFDGTYFEVVDSNATCNLIEGESCTVEWSVNASGEKNTFHELDFEASSDYSEIEAENSGSTVVEIRDILMMDLDWDVIDFGTLDPGEEDNPAENNSKGYNLTVEEDSNTVDNLWVKASNLVSDLDSNYTIGEGNMSYAEDRNAEDPSNMTSSYSLIDTDLSPRTVKTFYYWLDVPYGIIKDSYSGTVTFKANHTQQ